jgi:hypothetical protein
LAAQPPRIVIEKNKPPVPNNGYIPPPTDNARSHPIHGHGFRRRVDVLLGCVVELRMDWAGVSTDGASRVVARGAIFGCHAMVTFVCSFFK